MKGKTVVITGGNDGIGFATAKELALQGANLLLVCRNEQKAQLAVQRLHTETGTNNATYVMADLLSFASVRQAAAQIIACTTAIDVLINNAGATFSRFELGEDGYEKTITTNHLSHFLLTGLLLPHIQRSTYARIINVASHSHFGFGVSMDIESFTRNKSYFIMRAYAQSKLANVMFTLDLARKLQNTHVMVNALHPGTIKTDIGAKSAMSSFHAWAWSVWSGVVGLSIKQGAKTSIYLASSPDVEGISGRYYSCTGTLNRLWDKPKAVPYSKLADDADMRTKLWQTSEKACGIVCPNG